MVKSFVQWMDGVKHDRKTLRWFIAVNIVMAIASNIVDYTWLMSVDWYLRPFTPICSLFPLTLAIWMSLFYFKKKIPAWFTTFIFIGITTYGVMAYIYYPLYMGWSGVHWRLIGNMLWVTIYALQSLIIVSELKPLPLYQYVLVIGYFAFKDYSDRFLGSFIDIKQPNFPEHLKNIFAICVVIFHTAFSSLAIMLGERKKQSQNSPLSFVSPKTK